MIYGEPIFWQPDDLFQQAQQARSHAQQAQNAARQAQNQANQAGQQGRNQGPTRQDLVEVFDLHAQGRTKVIATGRKLDDVNASIDDVLAGTVPARIVFEF